MGGLFLKLLNMSITASWIVVAVVLLRVILKKAPKWIRCILWGIVGLRLIWPFSFESVVSLIPSAETVSKDAHVARPDIQTGVSVVDEQINSYLGSSYYEGVTVPTDHFSNSMDWLGLIWLVGLIVMLVYMAVSFLLLYRKVWISLHYVDNIYLCDGIQSPFILGMLRPRIYIPSGMEEEQISYVLDHEKAHLKRRDHYWKPLGFALLSVYWFNPMMWVAYILLCRDIELACDEKAIQKMTAVEKKGYSEALVACSMQRRMVMACPLAFGEVNVKKRIQSVLRYKKPAFWVIAVALFLCGAALVCFLTNPTKRTLKNIEDRTLSNTFKNTVSVMLGNGESYRAIEKTDEKMLKELADIEIAEVAFNQDRSETRDRSHTLVLRTKSDCELTIYSYIKGTYISFNHDYSLVWVNDGVKPTLSYRVQEPEKAERIFMVFSDSLPRNDVFSYNTAAEWGGGSFKLEDGILYAKGKDANGFLGDDPAAYYTEWSKIRNVEADNIVHLEVCGGTLIYMTEDGEVFGMGYTEGVFTEEAYSAVDERAYIKQPRLLMKDCRYVSLGNGFVLMLKQDDSLWFMGSSKNGQGTQVTARIGTPMQIAREVSFAKAFGYTSSWLTKNRELYLCGDNSHGQIGTGEVGCGFPTLYRDIVETPYLALADCVGFSVDSDSAITATKADGRVYTWGNGNAFEASAETNRIKNAVREDVKAYYTALYSGADAVPKLILPLKKACKTLIEKRYAYDVQVPQWVGIKEITNPAVSVTEQATVGPYCIYEVEMRLSFLYAEDGAVGKVTRKMQIAVDTTDEAVLADWHERNSYYEMELRGVTDLKDPACLLENSDISYDNAPIEVEWPAEYLPMNIKPPAVDGRVFTYSNPNVSGRDLMGFMSLIYYDQSSGDYVNNIEGWGNDCVEKAEFTRDYLKIFFAEGTVLDGLMFKIGGSVRVNSYVQKRLTDTGEPTYYVKSKRDFSYEASDSYFKKENGRDIMLLCFDKPLTEPISSLEIQWGKID